jgi:hypothetical protein
MAVPRIGRPRPSGPIIIDGDKIVGADQR